MAEEQPESGTRLTAVEIHDNIRSAAGQTDWGTMLKEFVVPSVIGNAIGGVLLVALLNYGQVAAERNGGNDEADKAARQ